MTHPECLHATSDALGYSGATCCVCDNAPCEAVTVEQMRAHREFDIALYSEAGVACVPPF